MESNSINTYLVALALALVLFAGLLFGHRIGLSREKKREYDLIVTPVRQDLLSHYDLISQQFPVISNEQLAQVKSVMSAIHRRGFEKAYALYLHSLNQLGFTRNDGSVRYTDTEIIDRHFQKVLTHLQNKEPA